jgi:hypothetical protein
MTWSAISFRGRTICYEVDGERIEAREPFPITDELRAAIEVERQHQAAKVYSE